MIRSVESLSARNNVGKSASDMSEVYFSLKVQCVGLKGIQAEM